MTSTERVLSVLQGRRPDRPPYSFWAHFPPDQVHGEAAVRAHVEHLETYQLDFLKVMNDNAYPHEARIRQPDDLAKLKELGGDEAGFGRQLELLSRLRARLGRDVLLTTTIFNAWTILRHLIEPPTEHTPPDMNASADAPSRLIKSFHTQDPQAVEAALQRIAASLANFARRCLDAGADGVYLSVRDDWVRPSPPAEPADLYDTLVRPTDLAILQAASAGQLNILHVCGAPVQFRSFAAYPAHAISWADRVAGPPIADVKTWAKPALCAGVDNLHTLPQGTPQDVERQVTDALTQAGLRPLILAPGCTYDPHRVPAGNLRALAAAARKWTYAGAS